MSQEDSLEEGMATHSTILAWRIPWTEEPNRLQFMDCKESDMTEHTNLVRLLLAETASQIFLFLPAVCYLVSKLCLTHGL